MNGRIERCAEMRDGRIRSYFVHMDSGPFGAWMRDEPESEAESKAEAAADTQF